MGIDVGLDMIQRIQRIPHCAGYLGGNERCVDRGDNFQKTVLLPLPGNPQGDDGGRCVAARAQANKTHVSFFAGRATIDTTGITSLPGGAGVAPGR